MASLEASIKPTVNQTVIHTLAPDILNSGDTAWMLTSTALVLFMCLPGLALYYGGQTQAKNVLSTVAQTFSLACMITILWLMMGYSLCFSTGSAVYGDASRFWLIGTNDAGNQRSPHRINVNSAHSLAPTIPESVFVVYQVRSCTANCDSLPARCELHRTLRHEIMKSWLRMVQLACSMMSTPSESSRKLTQLNLERRCRDLCPMP